MSEIGLIRALEVAEAPGMIVSLEVLRGTPGSPGTLEWTAAAGGGVTLTGGQANPNPTPALARQADLNGLVARVAVLEGRPVIDAEFIQDTVGGMFPGATYNDTAGTITLPPGSDPEAVRDTVAAFVRAGLNVTVTHDDAGDTLTLGAAGGTAVTRPRGTGGTQFRAVTRTPGSNTYTDLLPSSPAAAFDDSVFRVLGAGNTIAAPGEDVEMTGSGLVAGKTYYVDTPTSGTAPNMTAKPDNAPADFPTGNAAIVNVNRRYREAGTTWADGNKLWLTVSTRPVELSEAAAPVTVRRLDVAGLPYDTPLVAGGQLARLLQVTGATASATRLLANGDTGVSASLATSPIIKNVNGVDRPVMVKEIPFGSYDLRYVPGWPDLLGFDALMEFQTETADFNLVLPSIFFGGSGSNTAGVAGAHHAVQGYTGNIVLHRIVTSGNTISSDTGLGSAGIGTSWTPFELWNMRTRVVVDEAANTKKVYGRVWKTGTAEPGTWQLNGLNAPDLVAGKVGYRFKNGVNYVTRFALAPPGETASYA